MRLKTQRKRQHMQMLLRWNECSRDTKVIGSVLVDLTHQII